MIPKLTRDGPSCQWSGGRAARTGNSSQRKLNCETAEREEKWKGERREETLTEVLLDLSVWPGGVIITF